MIQILEKHTRLLSLFIIPFLILVLLPKVLFAQESNEAYHERMRWWDDGRLGMFLHWGIYSTFGGEYNGRDYGKEVGQASAEWIYLKSNMTEKEYRNAALNWNPDQFDAEEWVKMAKNAGMKYMVLTAKHHDGYALFKSEVSDWNIVNSSAIKRDLVKEFIAACRKYNMKVGFYYSHEKDWKHHRRQNKDPNPIPEKYVTFAKRQITELLTQYGKIDLIWYDTPVHTHEDFNRMCAGLIRKYQPECIINGRIGNGLGDYKNIGDRAIVDPGLAGYMESIMTMRVNWGFDKNDDYWKSSDDLIKMVCKSACRGSNFLLNIGPRPDGTFPVEDQVRLKNLGEWMTKNGEAIYKTKGSPFSKEHKWGSVTISKDQNMVYLHLWNWDGGEILLKGLTSKITKAGFLDSEQSVVFEPVSKTKTKIILPEINQSSTARIVKLELESSPEFDLSAGPDFEGQKVHYVTTRLIKGKITAVDGTNFTLKGRHVVGSDYEFYEETEKSLSFTLNDNVKFRINESGDIRLVNGYTLEKGKICKIVYSPYKEGAVVEIITEMR